MAKLYFYYSAMNAGKSAMLLQSDHNYRERGMHTLLLTCRFDNRYGGGVITSRIGLQQPAVLFDKKMDLLVLISKMHAEEAINCVLIDESQFLEPAQVLQLSLVVDKLNIPILCYGLRTDFRGEPFPGAMYLLAWADELNELKTICASGKKAIMNARLDAGGERLWDGRQVEIGHHYLSMSRREFELEKASPIGYEIPDTAVIPRD